MILHNYFFWNSAVITESSIPQIPTVEGCLPAHIVLHKASWVLYIGTFTALHIYDQSQSYNTI
jgi:hypothetical protein